MADSTMTVKLVPGLDEDALRDEVLKVIAGHAIVKPGETLVIRVGDWNPEQVEYYQEYLDHRDLPFRALVVIGDELAVAKPEPRVTVEVVTGSAQASAGDFERVLREQVRREGASARRKLA